MFNFKAAGDHFDEGAANEIWSLHIVPNLLSFALKVKSLLWT